MKLLLLCCVFAVAVVTVTSQHTDEGKQCGDDNDCGCGGHGGTCHHGHCSCNHHHEVRQHTGTHCMSHDDCRGGCHGDCVNNRCVCRTCSANHECHPCHCHNGHCSCINIFVKRQHHHDTCTTNDECASCNGECKNGHCHCHHSHCNPPCSGEHCHCRHDQTCHCPPTTAPPSP